MPPSRQEGLAARLAWRGRTPAESALLGARKSCKACGGPIGEGEAMFPVQDVGRMHLRCAEEHAAARGVPLLMPVCKHWRRRGLCLYQDVCVYRHPEEQRGSEMRGLPQAKQQSSRQGGCGAAGREHKEEEGAKSASQADGGRGAGTEAAAPAATPSALQVPRRPNKAVKKDFRAGALRHFVLETWGREALCAGSGVLEVAGGKGQLSFELLNLNGVPCTVVEPRPLDLRRPSQWLLEGFFHRNAGFAGAVHRPLPLCSAEGPQAPAHLRMAFDRGLWEAALGCPDTGEPGGDLLREVHRCMAAALDPSWLAGTAHHEGLPQQRPPQLEQSPTHGAGAHAAEQRDSPGEVAVRRPPTSGDTAGAAGSARSSGAAGPSPPEQAAAAAAALRWRHASLVVGMHPDQATEAIVDFALAAGTSFAVVPCCVFPEDFPHRRLPCGAQVRSYEDFITYLAGKDSRVLTARLPCGGRNTVVYLKA